MKLHAYYDSLYDHFGPQNWWPADSPWEVCIGVILVQNTNWKNVEMAIQNLKDKHCLDVDSIIKIKHDLLAELIRPSGYFNIKTKRLKATAEWWQKNRHAAAGWSVERLRRSLLEVNGIGEESADSIILYAFNKPVFVVDTYTRRILSRHGLIHETASYEETQALFSELSKDSNLFNEFHALLVHVGKHFCKRIAHCEGCPLKGVEEKK